MKIDLSIPNRARGKNIHIIAGHEEIARRLGRTGKWEVKTVPCNRCGKCCMNMIETWDYGVDPETGWCKGLKYEANEYVCTIDTHLCMISDHAGREHCCVKWEEVK
jgi:hypothetical protein